MFAVDQLWRFSQCSYTQPTNLCSKTRAWASNVKPRGYCYDQNLNNTMLSLYIMAVIQLRSSCLCSWAFIQKYESEDKETH